MGSPFEPPPRTVSYAVREALAAFRRAPVLTGLASAMVGLALFVIGLFGLAAFNLQEALTLLEERVGIVLYLRDDTRSQEIDLAYGELSSLPEVAEVHFVNKEGALEKARTELPDLGELFSDLAVNPLPASLEVRLRPGYRNQEVVERIASLSSAYAFVEDVAYGQEWVERLFALRRAAGLTVAVLGAAFAVVAALIIGTALRIAIFARREEIYGHATRGGHAGVHSASVPPRGRDGGPPRGRRGRVAHLSHLQGGVCFRILSLVDPGWLGRSRSRSWWRFRSVVERPLGGQAPEGGVTVRRSLIAASMVLAWLVTPNPVAAQDGDLQRQIAESRRRLEEIRAERERLQSELERARTGVRDVVGELQNIERQLGVSRSVLGELDLQLEIASRAAEQNTRSLVITRERHQEANAILHRRLRDIYKMGALHSVRVLLGADSFADLLNRYRYLHMIASYDRSLPPARVGPRRGPGQPKRGAPQQQGRPRSFEAVEARRGEPAAERRG